MNILPQLKNAQSFFWQNPHKLPFSQVSYDFPMDPESILDAQARLNRFAPLIRRLFPETEGIIESPLTPIPNAAQALEIPGRLLLKRDSELPIAGSVKARGGIYEVLKHTEDLAREAGILDYSLLADHRDLFAQYKMQVGSTGNLGLSIGIMSAAIGYQAIVHMSADARQWKKDLLRSHGVTVVEYDGDYSAAVRQGRMESNADPKSYFVDDENSRDLFFGYATAAKALAAQLEQQQIPVDPQHPLFVHIPCGVGGAPGGISYGLKQIFGDQVHCFFAEPTQCPSVVLGMSTGLGSKICVKDIGLSGQTHADGLAVGCPSQFVCNVMKPLLSGIVTTPDAQLYKDMRLLLDRENIFIEPSACAAFQGPRLLLDSTYFTHHGIDPQNVTHVLWATGGRLVPEEIRQEYIACYL